MNLFARFMEECMSDHRDADQRLSGSGSKHEAQQSRMASDAKDPLVLIVDCLAQMPDHDPRQ